MARLKLSQAARLAGVSRSAMDRALRAGRVSYEVDARGQRWMDPSELARAYPDPARPVPHGPDRDATGRDAETALLREIIEMQRAQLRDLTAERDKLLAMLEPRLLEDRRPWWRKIWGD